MKENNLRASKTFYYQNNQFSIGSQISDTCEGKQEYLTNHAILEILRRAS